MINNNIFIQVAMPTSPLLFPALSPTGWLAYTGHQHLAHASGVECSSVRVTTHFFAIPIIYLIYLSQSLDSNIFV